MAISEHAAATPQQCEHLRPLEQRVLAEVASGATNEEIAERLGYSPNYIKDVVVAAREHLRARDRAHAAALAVAYGLVQRTGDRVFSPVQPAVQHLTRS